jgi:arabinogalactan oligomer / maltooligosaccharide transport system permease protein
VKVRLGERILAHGVLILASIAVLYPVLWVVKMAFSPSQAFSMSLSLLPEQWTLENFRVLLTANDGIFFRQMLNSVIVAAATTVVGVVLSCTAAYAFSRFRFPGRQVGMATFLITQMFPGVVMAIPLYILLDNLGLLNSLTGLVLVYSTTAVPFCVWMLKGYFDTIPVDLEEAAVMDGAGQWTIFTKIVLPLAQPAIAVTALFSFMTAWNEFILAATFLSDERMYTVPVVLQQFVGDYNTEWGYFAAGAIIVSVPVMALFFKLQTYLVGGLTAGAVKG